MSEINREDVHTVKRTHLKTPNSEKSVGSSNFINYLQEINEFQPPQQCYEHYNDVITHICIDCDYRCVCATCLQEGEHKQHVVKNIEKGSKIADRILNQYLIRLRSKSDLLTLLKQNVAIRKNQLYSEYKECQQTIENNFKILMNDIHVQRESLLVKLKKYHDLQVFRIEETLRLIKNQSEISLNMIDYLNSNIQKLEAVSLCVFFKDKKDDIEEILDEDRQKYESLKNKVEDIKWIVDCNIFDDIRQKISQIQFFEDDTYIQLRDRPKSRKLSVKKSQSRKKSVCEIQISRQSATAGCVTPKNYDPKKKISHFMKNNSSKKLKKSSQSSKLVSIPTSPLQISTPKHKSPVKQPMDLQRQNRILQKIQEESAQNSIFRKIKPNR